MYAAGRGSGDQLIPARPSALLETVLKPPNRPPTAFVNTKSDGGSGIVSEEVDDRRVYRDVPRLTIFRGLRRKQDKTRSKVQIFHLRLRISPLRIPVWSATVTIARR